MLARLRLRCEAAESLLCGGQQLCRLGGDARELRARGGDPREVGGAALGVEPAEQRCVRAAQPTEPREGHLVQRAEVRRAALCSPTCPARPWTRTASTSASSSFSRVTDAGSRSSSSMASA